MSKRTAGLCLGALLVLAGANSAKAVVYFTDDFEYADGPLTTGSGGAWVNHSGLANQMQVVGEEAVLFTRLGGTAGMTQTGIDEDVNRTTGSSLTPGDTWYYGVQFSIEDNRPTTSTVVSPTYFMHFKDGGTFNFRGRLYVTAGSNATTYKLGVASSSTALNAAATWATNLTFGQTYTAIVSYKGSEHDARPFLDPPTNAIPNPDFEPLVGDDGYASLWIDPATIASTKVTDTMPPDNVGTDVLSGMSALVLRQGDSGTQVGSPPKGANSVKINADIVSIGDDFDAVLAAVGGAPVVEDADFDNDGDKDGQDFLIWQRGNGTTGAGATNAVGNANGDTNVNGADLAIWEADFGSAVSAANPVPEPASIGLALLGGLAAVGFARRRS